MELLLLIALIVIFIIVLNIQSRQQKHAEIFKKEITDLKNRLHDLRENISSPAGLSQNINDAQQLEKEAAELKAQEEYRNKIAALEEMERRREARRKDAAQTAAVNTDPAERIREVLADEKIEAPPVFPEQKENKIDKWFRNNPDLEKFIGENLVSKIGIAVLVLAIGFFVKYAIDNDWIGPVGRVSVGIICGSILIAIAHRLRNLYRGFSSVLAGGGLAVFYFTITLAFHQFHLFDQTVAFIIMTVITVFAVLLSLLYDKQELAVIALIGGFLSPFLISTGSGNYKVLFIYLIVLNSGILTIAYHKAWRLLNILSFIFTTLLFGSWLFNLPYSEPPATYRNGFVFATIFYLMYFGINIAYNIREKKKFIASDFGILLANTALYFSAGLICLHNMYADDMRGIFSAAMGVFNLTASYFLFRKKKVDTNILYLLIGITLTFVSVTAPLQLHGNFITLFWASETVLLYWLFTKSSIRIIQYAAGIVWMLMLASLFMDWSLVYSYFSDPVNIVFNKGFITSLFAAVSTYALFLLRNAESASEKIAGIDLLPGKNSFRIIALVLLFLAGALEINFQFMQHYPNDDFNRLWVLLYSMCFVSMALLISQKIKALNVPQRISGFLISACLLIYLLSVKQVFSIQADILISGKNHWQFIAHWLTAVVVMFLFYRLIMMVRQNAEVIKAGVNFYTWMLCAFAVIFISAESHLIVNSIFYNSENSLNHIQQVFIKTGLPILWGLCSFAFMWLGMHFKFRTLRIISLSLFTLTLLKLFIFDIRNIPAGGKIAAFFSLGVLLLVVSFMYQRLKKIIIDDEKKNN